MKYSVTSVILPDLDVPETCQLLQELGYDGIEWRVRYTKPEAVGKGYAFWGEHKTGLSPANIAEKADEVARITADHGLAIACIAANLRCDELDDVKRLADGVARMGDVPIRLGAPKGYDRTVPYPVLYEQAVEAYAKALEVLKPYGLRAIIEIHGGTIMVSASLAYRIVSNFSPSEIGVIYDVNNMAKDGFETFRIGMELLGDYLQHCHAGGWRPVAKERRDDGTLEWGYDGCDLADSILDIAQFIADLRAVDYQGFISIEDFRSMDHREKLKRQIDYLRGLE
ncbi:MAG: sugar phosphate isomerase/epimerase [Candidatus Hydrogenedentes bacterium]|nr:sugar phosphate isomerase/epimerase [Candidatus Hydrogenedentota bacterium]